MYKIPANTLFLGKQLVFVPECHSTNTLGLQLGQNQSTVEGTIIITNNQTAGRGQRGNSWESAPVMNLTFSVILKPGFLAVRDQFYLTIVVSLAVRDFLLKNIMNVPIAIKWPNDILVYQKKICGILIENLIQGAAFTITVAGIGLNINQTQFQTPAAISIKSITGKEKPIEAALHELLECLEKRYLQLRHQQYAQLKEEYLSNLFWKNEYRKFSAHEMTFEGSIKNVDENGRLVIETKEGLSSFGIKEIQFVE